MASESLDFSGCPESTVEMKDARDRAFTPICEVTISYILLNCRNEGRPGQGIYTQPQIQWFHRF